MSKHTSTPWQIGSLNLRAICKAAEGIADGYDSYMVAVTSAHNLVDHEEARANAACIVRAVNSHDDLVKALEPFVALANTVFELYETRPGEFREAFGDKPDEKTIWSFNRAALTYGHLRAARAALAKAKGEA